MDDLMALANQWDRWDSNPLIQEVELLPYREKISSSRSHYNARSYKRKWRRRGASAVHRLFEVLDGRTVEWLENKVREICRVHYVRYSYFMVFFERQYLYEHQRFRLKHQRWNLPLGIFTHPVYKIIDGVFHLGYLHPEKGLLKTKFMLEKKPKLLKKRRRLLFCDKCNQVKRSIFMEDFTSSEYKYNSKTDSYDMIVRTFYTIKARKCTCKKKQETAEIKENKRLQRSNPKFIYL